MRLDLWSPQPGCSGLISRRKVLSFPFFTAKGKKSLQEHGAGGAGAAAGLQLSAVAPAEALLPLRPARRCVLCSAHTWLLRLNYACW